MIWLDFETSSECDLKARGVYNYARDLSTTVLCMAYAHDDEDVSVWTPDQPFPQRVADAVLAGERLVAHNAAFERLIWKYVLGPDYRVPVPNIAQWYCTAAQARANCAPGSLEDVGRFAGASMRKDHRGAQLVRKCCCPPFKHTDQDLQDLFDYCAQDVRAMRAISQAMRPLTEEELADYHVNERINDRGVMVDVSLAEAAQRYAAAELQDIQHRVVEVTGGKITSVRSPRMREWVLARLGPEARKLTVVHKDGEAKDSIDKSVRANLLALAEEDPVEVPPDVAEVIQAADDLWASSAAKFGRMANLADDEDHRVRGAFVFAGGSATGRASSYGLQAHNFPRVCAKDPAAVRAAMLGGHPIAPAFGKRVTDVLKSMLRASLVPRPGHVFVGADWSAIEGRVHPWLADSPAGEAKLDVFRSGMDPYKVNASATFGVGYDDVTKDQRQVGKVQELACLGPETQVLTNNGVKAIVDVTIDDLLWDGQTWVTHQGVIAKGQRQTISVCGLEVTPDHLIKIGATWTQAQQLVLSRRLRTQALEAGSVSLQCLTQSGFNRAPHGFVTQKFNAIAALRPIWSICTTFSKARLRGATHALKKPQVFGVRTFTNIPMPAQTMTIGDACLTGYLLAKTDATTPKIETIRTMGAGGSLYISLGAQTKPRFFGTFSRLMDGINRTLSWIASTSTKVTSRVIFGSSQSKQTGPTSEKFKTCKDTSLNLRPVYDILNSGPRNQFTVLTDAGALIVHNCGFLGGVGSFDTFSRAYGIRFTEAEAQRAVNGWRRANPWATQHGEALERGYMTAMRHKNKEIAAGRVTYLFDGQHLWYALPSGRVLCYPFARLEEEGVTYAKAAWKPAADAKEWPRARLWRGLACENITQATANDILRHALRRLDGYGVVLHVHDEIVVETPEPDRIQTLMTDVMTTAPDWAQGLPLAIEAEVMSVYGK